MSLSSQKYRIGIWDPVSRENLFRIPDLGSRGQKGTGSRIRVRNTAYYLSCSFCILLSSYPNPACLTGCPAYCVSQTACLFCNLQPILLVQEPLLLFLQLSLSPHPFSLFLLSCIIFAVAGVSLLKETAYPAAFPALLAAKVSCFSTSCLSWPIFTQLMLPVHIFLPLPILLILELILLIQVPYLFCSSSSISFWSCSLSFWSCSLCCSVEHSSCLSCSLSCPSFSSPCSLSLWSYSLCSSLYHLLAFPVAYPAHPAANSLHPVSYPFGPVACAACSTIFLPFL
jgi:hypothetical protein